jgi:hypothetical protein
LLLLLLELLGWLRVVAEVHHHQPLLQSSQLWTL